jgi:MFS family permease
MGLGILESSSMEHVPGTTRYFDDPERPQIATGDTVGLKCDRSGPVPIILVPQPSDDPNDPLNWPLWKRDVILLILSICSVFATSLGPILAANTLTLSLYYHKKFTQVALLTGYFLLGVGVAGIFYVPSARIWGKRHTFLIGTVLLIFTALWGGRAQARNKHGYTSMLWSRIFQGVATAPFEALVNAAVGDLYFVHERGKRMALTNLAVFGGAFATPIFVGKITHTIGWPWSFYFVAIFTAAVLPFLIFFVPETAYVRSAHLNTDMVSTEDLRTFSRAGQPSGANGESLDPINRQSGSQDDTSQEKGQGAPEIESQAEMFGNAATPKRTLLQEAMPFNGRKSSESFWKLLLRPFPLFLNPGILWACLIQASLIGWTVFIGVILAAVFLGPPLFWDEVNTGYAYTGAFIGSILGFLIAGALSDWSAKYMTKRNHGVYEPEFRIVLVIPQMIFGCAGLYLFGITSAKLVDYSWVLPILGFCFVTMGMVIGAVAASLYVVDAHRDIAIESFTCLLMMKNFLCFGLSWKAYDWVVMGGTYKVFMWVASIQIILCLSSIPMYIFGKKNRSFTHRHNILRACGLT